MRLRHRVWGDKIIEEHPELVITREQLDSQILTDFLAKDNLVLEIGSGKGDFAIQMAKKYPEWNFVGVEMNEMALAITLKKLVNEELKNILMINCDVNRLFELLPSHRFERIFLNFSDPWPKKRQHKRRLTYPTFLTQYERLLVKGGYLAFKTDNDELFKDSCEYLKASNFETITIDYDYDGHEIVDAQTEYETKFRKQQIKIKRFVVRSK